MLTDTQILYQLSTKKSIDIQFSLKPYLIIIAFFRIL